MTLPSNAAHVTPTAVLLTTANGASPTANGASPTANGTSPTATTRFQFSIALHN